MSKGTDLIAAERERQVTEEGYTVEHDAGHASDLIQAAGCYAAEADGQVRGFAASEPGVVPLSDSDLGLSNWPWAARYWKPTGDPVRDLVKAGALIAAAIDSLTADEAAL